MRLFIELSGLHGRRREMCQGEKEGESKKKKKEDKKMHQLRFVEVFFVVVLFSFSLTML